MQESWLFFLFVELSIVPCQMILTQTKCCKLTPNCAGKEAYFQFSVKMQNCIPKGPWIQAPSSTVVQGRGLGVRHPGSDLGLSTGLRGRLWVSGLLFLNLHLLAYKKRGLQFSPHRPVRKIMDIKHLIPFSTQFRVESSANSSSQDHLISRQARSMSTRIF